jgi:uncharacterized membrane protein
MMVLLIAVVLGLVLLGATLWREYRLRQAYRQRYEKWIKGDQR